MNFVETASWIIFVFVGLPILTYMCVKFGTYAFFKAKQLINKENKPQ
jgi:hypothetical protein